MYFLFSTVITASFLINAKLSALAFIVSLLLTLIYLYLFSIYFRCCQKTVAFIPLVLTSMSMHITFFLLELVNKYIKDISIWILAFLLIIVCSIIAFGTRSNTSIGAIANMSVPIFFLLVAFTLICLFTGEITTIPLCEVNIYQYILIIISPPSTALTLTYMQRCRFKKIWPAFVTSIAIMACFILFDAPFFKNIALTFIAPILIASEMLVIKETVFPSQESIDKKTKANIK